MIGARTTRPEEHRRALGIVERMLPPPDRSFASDNTAGIAPAVFAALSEANQGSAVAYGDDPFTAHFEELIGETFGSDAQALLTWGGTGANVVGLSALLQPYQGVICPESAHINVDECGAVERFAGCKLLDVPSGDGKLRVADIEKQLHVLGDVHHVQPGAISVTQATEYGTVYTLDELRELADVAKRAGLRVHMDGARIANAAAALGASLKELTVDIGVDVLSLGGTKNGIAYGEAVVILDPSLAEPARFHRKQAAQLPSKMRFIATQFNALLTDNLWLRHASHANAMAELLAAKAAEIPGVAITHPPGANALFATLDRAVVKRLQEWSFFHVWAPGERPNDGGEYRDEVRWMTSFETTEDDVDRFVAGIRAESTREA